MRSLLLGAAVALSLLSPLSQMTGCSSADPGWSPSDAAPKAADAAAKTDGGKADDAGAADLGAPDQAAPPPDQAGGG